jgi:hypothetical protein
LIAASLSCALLTAPGCGTDAQGIGDCRAIEQERCSAAANCGDSRGGKVVDDVGSCQRFYRDQCLHGTSTASPGAPQITDCVNAIRAAGECAAATPDTQDSLCGAPFITNPDVACDSILSPERLPDCRFLIPDPSGISEGGAPATTAGAGGQGNASSGEGEGGSVAAGGVSGG